MTKCKSCGAAGQSGTYCEECGKSVVGGSKDVSSKSNAYGAYKTQAIAVGIVVLALVGTFLLLSSNSSVGGANAASSGVDAGAQVAGSQNAGTNVPIAVTNTSVTNTDSYREISMKLSGGFVPNTFTVKAGQPVRWTIIGERTTGCVQDVVQRDFGINVPINNGETKVVTFTPETPGTYTFTCGMGMVKGKIIVVDPATGVAPGPAGLGGADSTCGGGSGGGCGGSSTGGCSGGSGGGCGCGCGG